MRLVLASRSPRRAELLRQAGFEFDTVAVDVDEAPRAGEPAADMVRRLAREKSASAWDAAFPQDSGLIVLAADTAVVVGDAILGKPRDEAEAAGMLRRLSGRVHDVLTGVSLRTLTAEVGMVERTAVWFDSMDDREIAWYVASGEGRDKAGAYAIQGLAGRFIPRIEGSYANVAGLPVAAVYRLLETLGASEPRGGFRRPGG
jgi:septum formation protein